MKRLLLSPVVGLLLLMGALPQTARAGDVEPATLSKLIVRVLGYDRNLTLGKNDDLVVAIIFKKGDKNVEALTNEMSERRFLGRNVRPVAIEYTDPVALDEALIEASAHAAYICPDLERSVGLIVGITRARSIRSLTGTENSVHSGVGLGIVSRRTGPKLLVNLTAAKAEGAKLDANFLRFAEVVR